MKKLCLGNSANTDSIHQAKGEPGQAQVPAGTSIGSPYLPLKQTKMKNTVINFPKRTIFVCYVFGPQKHGGDKLG